MCGRYVMATPESELVALFDIDAVGELPEPTWNLAPTDPAPIVVEPSPRDDAPPLRRLEAATWGLVPTWAKDAKGAARAINARSETVASKPTFQTAVQRRRAIVPADGWYEWRKPDRTPFFVHADRPIGFAGLYEWWKRPDGTWLLSSTILTAEAVGELAELHPRMPVVLPTELWDAWLDPGTPGDQGLVDDAVAAAADAVGALSLRTVGPAVGNVRNDGPELVAPIA